MEQFAVFLFLISCDPQLQVCREVPADTVAYDSIDECRAEKAIALRHGEHPDETLFARCVSVDPEVLEADAEIAWYIDRGGRLEVEISGHPTYPARVAGDPRGNPRL